MKNYNIIVSILISILIVFFFSTAQAQEELTPEASQRNINQKPRPNLLALLDLTQNQIQQIRLINQQNKLKRREAQRRVMDAQKALDQAIYADSVDETEIETKLRNLQLAQAEIITLRSMTELAIRRILTPEQLVKFREVRQRFMEGIETRFNNPQNRPFNNPNKRFGNRRRGMRPGN